MCGISGFYSPDKRYRLSNLEEMMSKLSHRGPDAEGHFFNGICGLGHKRLSILDLQNRADQPMVSQNQRFVIAYNGEVYNYRELARQIETNLKTTSDTEVILELFGQQGVRMVYQLNGMFALAIYDKVQNDLYLIRDRMGIKPLYYYCENLNAPQEGIAFASELKALLNLPNLNLSIDHRAVADFLHLGYIPNERTIFSHIKKLPSGSWLRLNNKEYHVETYWKAPEKIYDSPTQQKLSLLTREKEAKKQLKKLLASSVEYRMISDVPLGIFLSGGVDSSTLAALACENSSSPIKTFSIGFKEDAHNEAPYAQAVAKELKTDHHEFEVSIEEAKELIPKLVEIYDEPFADSSAIPVYMVSQMARKHVKVAIGGDGGDELFLGYGSYLWADRLAQSYWKLFRKPAAKSLSWMKASRYQKASRILAYNTRQSLPSHIFSQEQFLFSQKELKQLIVTQEEGIHYPASLASRKLNPMENQALFDLEYYLPDDLLVKVDRASMHHGLEVRVPLLDHRLVEFAINLSPELRFHKGTSKYLLKQVLYDYLPEKLFNRPKRGFSIPLKDWLKTDLAYLIDTYLNKEIIEQYGIVHYAPVAIMKNKFKAGHDYYYNRLWALIVLHQFLDKYPTA